MFCRTHLPKDDVKIVLEDEEGKICKTKYKAYRTGLSGGWHGFVDQHGLKVGDVLVFQLVQPTRFKASALSTAPFMIYFFPSARPEHYPYLGKFC